MKQCASRGVSGVIDGLVLECAESGDAEGEEWCRGKGGEERGEMGKDVTLVIHLNISFVIQRTITHSKK